MFSRKIFLLGALAATLAADLPDWISSIEVRHKLEDVFYRSVTFGAVGIFRTRAPVPPPEFRARPYAVRMTHGMFAAA